MIFLSADDNDNHASYGALRAYFSNLGNHQGGLRRGHMSCVIALGVATVVDIVLYL